VEVVSDIFKPLPGIISFIYYKNYTMSSIRSLLGKIALEVPAVVLAVFLALGVNNCNEDQKQRYAAQKTLAAIRLEISDNKNAIESNIDDNRAKIEQMVMLLDTIKKTGGRPSEYDMEIGYEQTFLSTAAWEMAQITGATQKFTPEMVQRLSLIYDLQRMYLQQGDRFFEKMADIHFYESSESNPRAALSAMLSLAQLANAVGEKTVEQYEEFLEVATED
jgi:hypothetical protein